MIKIGIAGGAGYTAGELIRILLNHPHAEIEFIYSTSNAGNLLSKVHNDLIGDTCLKFSSTINPDIDLLFLCLGHGHSGDFLKNNPFSTKTKIIDLSNEFRLEENISFKNRIFTYGLPELQKESIIKSNNIANPGCFATAIQLALLPLSKNKCLENNEINIHAITGSTGAGQSLGSTSHFSWRNNNISSYKVFNHQHLDEINQTLKSLQPSYTKDLNFIPLRGDFSRGIFATLFTRTTLSEQEIKILFKEYYLEDPFTIISEEPIHLKQVIGTNKCLLHIEKHGDKVIVTSIIDNLIKGASGQAVQNMNLMFGLSETTGLKLKAIYF